MDQRSDIITSQHDMFGPNEHRLSETLVTQEISITPPEHRTTCTSRPCHAMLLLARLYITSNQILIFIKAMSAYNDLRNLILQGALRLQTLRVYVSENENLQSEWVLTDIF